MDKQVYWDLQLTIACCFFYLSSKMRTSTIITAGWWPKSLGYCPAKNSVGYVCIVSNEENGQLLWSVCQEENSDFVKQKKQGYMTKLNGQCENRTPRDLRLPFIE